MNQKSNSTSISDCGSRVRRLDLHTSRANALMSSILAVGLALGGSLAGAQTVVTQDLVLTADHEGPLAIYSSGITVDCQNFRVIQTQPLNQESFPADYSGNEGILIYNTYDVTVQNCNIEDFWWGIRVVGSTGVKLIDNTVNEVTQPTSGWVVRRAFAVEASQGNDLIGNTEADTGADGFVLVNSTDNLLTGNAAGGGGNAYELFTAHDNQFLNNTAAAGGDGFNIGGSNGNQLIANEVSGQTNGFRIYSGASDNQIRANAITNNTNGILVCPELYDLNSLIPNRFRDNESDIVTSVDAGGCEEE